jgi:A/G-specific adenine glycosylase
VIDTNIRRVLIFLYKLPETISLQELERFAEKIIPKKQSRDWHNALMDYGALELTARKTKIKPLSKQSKFEGSDRQVRGWILKQLTKDDTPLLISRVQEEFPKKDVKKIVDGMKKEKLIVVKK